MSLVDLGRTLRARWLVVVLCVLAGLAAAAVVTFSATPQYESSVSLYVSARAESGNAGSAYDASLVSAQRIASYAELATDARVLEPVIGRLGLPVGAENLAGDVTATSEPDTVILAVTVRYPSAPEAARIADAIGAELIGTVAQLEQAPGSQAPPPVGLALVRPATVPASPVSPSVVVNLLLGLAVGLAVGVGAALARQALDTTVSTSRRLREVVDAPVVGEIPRDDDPDVGLLTVRGRSNAPRPEAFRKLRTTLRFVSVDEPPVVVLVTSAVAGEGKSATTANLAIAMAEVGERVLVVEADLRLPQLATYLGVVGDVGVTSVLSGDMGPELAVQRVERGRFDVLTAGPLPPNPTELLSSQAMARLLVWARASYDRVLVDTPPVLPVTDAAVLGHRSDGALLIVRHGRTGIQDVEAATEQLRAASTRVLGTVLNGTPPRSSTYTPYHRVGGTPTGTTAAPSSPSPRVAAPHDGDRVPSGPVPAVRLPSGPIPTGRRQAPPSTDLDPATETIRITDEDKGTTPPSTGAAAPQTPEPSSTTETTREPTTTTTKSGPDSGRIPVRYTRLTAPLPEVADEESASDEDETPADSGPPSGSGDAPASRGPSPSPRREPVEEPAKEPATSAASAISDPVS